MLNSVLIFDCVTASVKQYSCVTSSPMSRMPSSSVLTIISRSTSRKRFPLLPLWTADDGAPDGGAVSLALMPMTATVTIHVSTASIAASSSVIFLLSGIFRLDVPPVDKFKVISGEGKETF